MEKTIGGRHLQCCSLYSVRLHVYWSRDYNTVIISYIGIHTCVYVYLLNSHRRRTERTRPRKQQTAAVARQAVVAVAVVVVAVVVVEMRVGP